MCRGRPAGLYRCSDIFAIASDVEVQSIPALQALATGLPIVAVNAAALPELVYPGLNGFLAPPEDPQALGEAIFQVLKDPDHLRVMGQASLALVKDHAEEETFQQYEFLPESCRSRRVYVIPACYHD
jgi:glycosyltransferase involved in cell wall biosynthesis